MNSFKMFSKASKELKENSNYKWSCNAYRKLKMNIIYTNEMERVKKCN